MQIRPLSIQHLQPCLTLFAEAGWNQTETDWRNFFALGKGYGYFDPDGHLVATAFLLPYPPHIGWISMMLVAPSWRRRGLATNLIRRCVDTCHELGLTPMLDATESGRRVYLTCGFSDISTITRYEGICTAAPPSEHVNSIHTLSPKDVNKLVVRDTTSFGSDRSHVLQALLDQKLARAFTLEDESGEMEGCALGRVGRVAYYVGPVIANTHEQAIELIVHVISDIKDKIYVDVPNEQNELIGWLEENGFTPQRQLVRMVHGDYPYQNHPDYHAIAGPEWG